MSGVAEGIAGLALSAVSVAALFTTCIECFDIAVAARNFSIDYELLVTALDVERLRFLLWGESVGLVPGCSETPYNNGLDRSDVRPVVERILLCIKHLLTETSDVKSRYGLKATVSRNPEGGEDEHRLQIFKATFDKFKNRVQKNQKEKSVWTVTRWAIHDATRFQDMITQLKNFVDGLESITKSLQGVLEKQQERFREEIESVSDVKSLRLLRDISSNSRHSETASNRILSDTASQRLARLDDIRFEGATRASHPASFSVDTSYCTAPTYPTSERSSTDPVPPENLETSFNHETLVNLPQNQRLVSAKLLRGTQNPNPRCIANIGVAGSALAQIQEQDLNRLKEIVSRPPQKNAERLILKRLSEFTKDPIPFISLAPIDSNIFDLLASIEGPPGSPYEGGVFYVRVAIPPEFPFKAPKCHFLTKIYHPNIDAKGKICLEILGSYWEPRHGRLEKLLLAICALLDDPFINDALVPEIAEIFIQDRRTFDENARLYTKKFANGLKPVISNSLERFLAETEITDYSIPIFARSTLSIYSATPTDMLASTYLETTAALIKSMLDLERRSKVKYRSNMLVDPILDWQRLSRNLVVLQARLSKKLISASKLRTLARLQDEEFLNTQARIQRLLNYYHQSRQSQSRVPAFSIFGRQYPNTARWFAHGAAASVLKQAWAYCLLKREGTISDIPPERNDDKGPYAPSLGHAEPRLWNESLSQTNDREYYYHQGRYKFWFTEVRKEDLSFPLPLDKNQQESKRWISPRPCYLVRQFVDDVGKDAAMAFFEDNLARNIDYESLLPNDKVKYLMDRSEVEYRRWLSPEHDIGRWRKHVDIVGKHAALEQLEKCSDIIRLSAARMEWDNLLHANDADVGSRRKDFMSENLLMCCEDLAYLTRRVISMTDLL